MANAGYLEYAPASARYALPPEHAPVLAQETGPVFFGGVHEEFVGLLGSFEKLLGHIRAGGGLNLDAYPDSMYEGIDRFTAGWFENLLISGVAAAGSARRDQTPEWSARGGCRLRPRSS